MENKLSESVFNTLNPINVNDHKEQRKSGGTELSYLSWPWAWAEVKKRYPDAVYTVYKDALGHPYMEDPDFGLMCYTTVTIQGQTLEMWLPVMNGANKAMRRTSYTYTVYNKFEKRDEEKIVEAATMFDINKTIMRCLVKNLAMFGLGLYIYSGEDLPDAESVDAPAPKAKAAAKPEAVPTPAPTPIPDDKLSDEEKEIKACNTQKEINNLFVKKGWTANVKLINYAKTVGANLPKE